MKHLPIIIVLTACFLAGLGFGASQHSCGASLAAKAAPPTQWVGADLCCCEISISPPPATVYITRSKWEQATGGNPDAYLAFHLDYSFTGGACYLGNPWVWEGTNPPGVCVPDGQVVVFAVYDGLPPYDPCEGCCAPPQAISD